MRGARISASTLWGSVWRGHGHVITLERFKKDFLGKILPLPLSCPPYVGRIRVVPISSGISSLSELREVIAELVAAAVA